MRAGGGAQHPGVPAQAGGRCGASSSVFALGRVQHPLPLLAPPITVDRGLGPPQEAAGREEVPLARAGPANALLAEPEVEVTLLGSAGSAAKEAVRRLWWRFSDWSRGKQGGAGGGVRGNTNRR